jgi:serine/threonine protein kinase
MATPRKRYQFIGKLGEGGMGAVWIAHDRLTGQRVALKQVKATVENAESDTLANTHLIDMRRALAQEFKTLSSLRHPHIVSVLDYGFDGGLPYFTMELLENAQSLLEAAPALRYEQQIEMLAQTLQALAYLHRRGILHRDLKPANVLVFKQEVRVVDFGLAVVNSFANPGFAGTLAYIAPEVLQGFQSSIQSDLYAVGGDRLRNIRRSAPVLDGRRHQHHSRRPQRSAGLGATGKQSVHHQLGHPIVKQESRRPLSRCQQRPHRPDGSRRNPPPAGDGHYPRKLFAGGQFRRARNRSRLADDGAAQRD